MKAYISENEKIDKAKKVWTSKYCHIFSKSEKFKGKLFTDFGLAVIKEAIQKALFLPETKGKL